MENEPEKLSVWETAFSPYRFVFTNPACCLLFVALVAACALLDVFSRGMAAGGGSFVVAFVLPNAAVLVFYAFLADYTIVRRLEGRASIAGSFARVLSRFLPLLALALVMFLMGFVPGFAFGFLLGASGHYSEVALFAWLWIALALCAAYLSLAYPVCVAEKKGPVASMRESVRLTAGNRLRLVAATFLAVAAATAIAVVCNFLTSLAMGHLIDASRSLSPTGMIVMVLQALAYCRLRYGIDGRTAGSRAALRP